MREIFTYGSVGGALGNQCFYPEFWGIIRPPTAGLWINFPLNLQHR